MVELLAPAGDFESLAAAINAGADAVYFGIEHLNMRVRRTKNFSIHEIGEIVKRCYSKKVKCYLTLNTIIYEHEGNKVSEILKASKKAGVDGVIAADFYVLQKARELGMEVHASTQLSVSNYEALKFVSQFCDRVVLARELTLPMIKSIKEKIIKENLKGPNRRVELECFAHGAMCIAVSGRCFMSLFEFNSSANRGVCLQSCRRSYKIIDKEEGHEMIVEHDKVMSPEDLCTIEFVDVLIEAGIDVLKIEGRGRAPDYVGTVVSAYRKAIDAIESGCYDDQLKKKLKEDISKVYNRGFSKGFYLGIPLGSWSNTYGSKATERKWLLGKVKNYFPKAGTAEIFLETGELSDGEKIGFSGETTGWFKQKAEKFQEEGHVLSSAKKGQTITLKVQKKVRKNDKLYVLRPASYKVECHGQ